MSPSSEEQILAQEEGVINRRVGTRAEIDTAFDVFGKETEGTLVLTTTRLLYVHGGETREDIPVGVMSRKTVFYTDVEDLRNIPADLNNLTIQLSSVTKVVGHHTLASAPKLEVTWTQGGTSRTTEFVQQVTGGSRKKNLNDWAPVIERLRSGEEAVASPTESPDAGSLDDKVLQALGDMQEKGLLTLESELEMKYKVDLEPEDVDAACQRLVAKGLIKSTGAKDEPPFYQKVSPLGSDSLDG